LSTPDRIEDEFMTDMTDISIIVPTRQRPGRALQMLNSLARTVRRPERVEVIFIIDDDDDSYEGFTFTALPLKWVRVKAGLTMGELNMAGYRISCGSHVMGLNDDVVATTEGWDEIVLSACRSVDDGIVLIHVNDHLFEAKLCTFPFMTRDMCERIGGFCHEGYRRYRIDDHIYNIFNLLSVLGHNRILYLPDVVFEHHNFLVTASGNREYQADLAIHAIDTKLFDQLLEDRKRIAVELASHIDARRERQISMIRAAVLAPITDSVSLRKPEYVRTWREHTGLSGGSTRVTIGIVTADLYSPHAQACIAAVKQFTDNYDLVVIDNNRGPNFNHPHEMNRIIAACRTSYLVLMDDDVIVEAGWLDGMLRCVGPRTGIVTPLHKGAAGNLSYAGGVMAPDHSGHHTHAFELGDSGFPVQTICSAIVLIDLDKCGYLRFDESYSKYFLDIDYGLRVWEAGFEVICSPHTMVTHIGGATLTQGSPLSVHLFEEQRLHFVGAWIETGRYAALESSSAWRESERIASILDAPARLERMLAPRAFDDRMQFLADAHEFFEWLRLYPAVFNWVRERLPRFNDECYPDFQSVDSWQDAAILGQAKYPVLMESNYRGQFNLALWNGQYYAMPPAEGAFDERLASSGGYSHLYQAARLPLLKILIDAGVRPPLNSPIAPKRPAEQVDPLLVEEGYRDHNIIFWNDRYYALAQSEGAFEPQRVERGAQPNCLEARSVAELKQVLDARREPVASRGFIYRGLRKGVLIARRIRRAMRASPPAAPRAMLLEESVNGVNIVRLGDWFYAVPRARCAVVLGQNDPSLLRDLPRAQKKSLLNVLIATGATREPDDEGARASGCNTQPSKV
jgi:GT2 family glycosyltransferase